MVIPPLNLDISNKNNIYQNLFSGGKGLRARLTGEVADCLNIPPKQQKILCRIVEYIHQASLLHDDVIDASPTRRGTLSGWRRYSLKKAVLAGDYLLAESAEETARLANIPLTELTARTLKKLVKGEWLQAEIKDQESMESLEKAHELKTASLFQWSLRAPFLLKGFYEENLQKQLNTIGRIMGLIFQRADDLLDFDIRNKENKTTFKDMKEGVFNSFAVHLLHVTNFFEETGRKGREPHRMNGKGEGRMALKACHSLKEVQQLTGEKAFAHALESFDKVSQQQIMTCNNEIEGLKKSLSGPAPSSAGFSNGTPDKKSPGVRIITPPERMQALINILKNWPENLYWRK